MITTTFIEKETINNTLLVSFYDNPKLSFVDMKYSMLHLYNPKPNAWFFYHIDDYLSEIEKYSNKYENILLYGGSKGGSAAIIISNLLQKKGIYQNILCWCFSPVLKIEWGKSLKSNKGFVSYVWNSIKDDLSIKYNVDLYGDIIKYIDCTFSVLYSYSYIPDWMFDKNTFDLVRHIKCITEDYVPAEEKVIDFNPKYPPYKNVHNILGYYWQANRPKFYEKLENFTTQYS